MRKVLKTMAKIAAVLAEITAALTALSMIVYYFNLDMKLTSAMQPLLNKVYDYVDRKRKL